MADIAFLTFPIEHPRSGMRYVQQIEQRSLLDFVLNAFVGMIAGKCFFARGVKQFGVKCGWIIYFSGTADLFCLIRTIVAKIRPDTQCQNIFTIFEAGFKRDDLVWISMRHVNKLSMMSRLRRV